MSEFEEKWTMRGLPDDHPGCIKTPEALLEYINKAGFLPLFRNSAPGFSVEEHVSADNWWTGNASDPWEWRMSLAASGEVAYGRFYGGKAGFVSKQWLPRFVNMRRDGYDFDSKADEGLANRRQMLIMKQFDTRPALPTYELKQLAGFGKGGEKNFEGTLHALEHGCYLVISEFTHKINKKGEPYGWSIAVMSPPENVFGYDYVRSAYSESPSESARIITEHISKLFSGAEREIL